MARPGFIGKLLVVLLLVAGISRAAPPTDACTAISIRIFATNFVDHFAQDFEDDDKEWCVNDTTVAFAAAVLVRFGDALPDMSPCRKLVARRAASLGVAPEEYLRRALVMMPPGSSVDMLSVDTRDSTKAYVGIISHQVAHPDAAALLARDIWGGLSGDKVDISGRLGVDNRDLELEIDTMSWPPLWMNAFMSATAVLDGIPGFKALDRWLYVRSLWTVPSIYVVKDAAARDVFARWLFLGWEKYWEKPDAALLKERPRTLSTFVIAARGEIPTVTDAATRDRLGIAPGRWEAFLRFIKESRSGSIAERYGWTRLPR